MDRVRHGFTRHSYACVMNSGGENCWLCWGDTAKPYSLASETGKLASNRRKTKGNLEDKSNKEVRKIEGMGRREKNRCWTEKTDRQTLTDQSLCCGNVSSVGWHRIDKSEREIWSVNEIKRSKKERMESEKKAMTERADTTD